MTYSNSDFAENLSHNAAPVSEITRLKSDFRW